MELTGNLVCIFVFMVIRDISSCMGTYHTEYVNVKKISGHISRNRRSAELEFPAQTVFRFNLAGDNVVLNLEHSSIHPRKQVPVYTADSTGVRHIETERQDNYALYQDMLQGASVLVKCPYGQPDDVQLFGEFSHKGSHYQIEPLTLRHRTKRELYNASQYHNHVVKRQALPDGDFYGDAIHPPSTVGRKNSRFSADVYPGAKETVPGVHVLQKGKPKYNKNTKDLQSDQESSRKRRSAKTLYIEYLVVADYKNFQRWKDKVSIDTGNDAETVVLNAMSEFYQFVVNGIDLRFRSATGSAGSEVRVVFSQLLVSTSASTSPWTERNRISGDNVDDSGVLYDFAMWKNSIKQYLPRHDHAALFTGYNMATQTSTNPIGLGYLNLICHSSWAVSEIEETYNAITVHIAAHELGHNMGTRHDGSGNGCNPSKWYLMAPRLPTVYKAENKNNPWKFSSCSQTNIRQFIYGLNRDNCLTNQPDSTVFPRENLIHPGIKYSPDKQCSMTYGDGTVLCREKLYGQWDSLCYAMQCKKKGSMTCEGRYFPFDGTPCGNKKWCQAGSCISSEDAPAADPTCPFGDDPSVDCSTKGYCDDFVYKNVFCCDSCRETTTITTTTAKTTTNSPTSSAISTISSTTTSTSTDTTNPPTSSTTQETTPLTSLISSTKTTSVSSTASTSQETTLFTSPLTSPISTANTTSSSSTQTPISSTTTSNNLSTNFTTLSSQKTSTKYPSTVTTTQSTTVSQKSSLSTTESTPSLSTAKTSSLPSSAITTFTSTITKTVSTTNSTPNSSEKPSITTLFTTKSTTNNTTPETTSNSTTSVYSTSTSTSTSLSTDSNVTSYSSTKYPTSTQTEITPESTLKTTFTSGTTSVSSPEPPTGSSKSSTTTTELSTSSQTASTIETSPKSTTDSIITSTSTTSPSTTTVPKTEISLKLQRMVSLFVAASIIV